MRLVRQFCRWFIDTFGNQIEGGGMPHSDKLRTVLDRVSHYSEAQQKVVNKTLLLRDDPLIMVGMFKGLGDKHALTADNIAVFSLNLQIKVDIVFDDLRCTKFFLMREPQADELDEYDRTNGLQVAIFELLHLERALDGVLSFELSGETTKFYRRG